MTQIPFPDYLIDKWVEKSDFWITNQKKSVSDWANCKQWVGKSPRGIRIVQEEEIAITATSRRTIGDGVLSTFWSCNNPFVEKQFVCEFLYSGFHPLLRLFAMFRYVFLCELQGPAWAVVSYSSRPQAGGIPQILIFKILRMTGWNSLYKTFQDLRI